MNRYATLPRERWTVVDKDGVHVGVYRKIDADLAARFLNAHGFYGPYTVLPTTAAKRVA